MAGAHPLALAGASAVSGVCSVPCCGAPISTVRFRVKKCRSPTSFLLGLHEVSVRALIYQVLIGDESRGTNTRVVEQDCARSQRQRAALTLRR